jgi:hypothetical protein
MKLTTHFYLVLMLIKNALSFTSIPKYRESNLSLSWLARNLFVNACPLLAARLIVTGCLLAYLNNAACLAFSCPQNMYKHSSQCCEI